MTYSRLVCAFALLSLSSLAFAEPSLETLRFNSSAIFGSAPGSLRFTRVQDASVQAAFAQQPSRTVDLAALRNKNLRAGLNARLGGKDVWISGAFDRGNYDAGKNIYSDPTAFVTISVEGEGSPRVFGVMDLLTNPQTIGIGSGQFKLRLYPDITDTYASEIVVINAADNHKDRITVRALLAAVGQAGVPVSLGGKAHKAFYYDEIKNGRVDPSSRLLAFSDESGSEPKVFTIPESSIPSGRVAGFKTLDGRDFGLSRDGDKLLIFSR